jgi:hypothetical protein
MGLDRIIINEISVLGPQMKTGVWNGHPGRRSQLFKKNKLMKKNKEL